MRKLMAGLAAAALVMATGFASAQTAQQKPSDSGMTNSPQAGTSGTNPTDQKSVKKKAAKKSGSTTGMGGGALKKDTGRMGTSSGGQGGGEGGSGK
ncbi:MULTISPECIES: hypothetical protein [unclassified Afipia]|uniref:hypothetical protein n=1 Tax=unclassified Afipia TaxID=2642050 RepID=UPI0004004FFB|nr:MULTISPECIES: hypothetical protein [unclassified Afipia]